MKEAPLVFALLFGSVAMVVTACGGAATPAVPKAATTPVAKVATPAPKVAATPTPTAAAAPKTTPAPAAAPAGTAALEISAVGEDLKFNTAKLTATAGQQVALTFKNGSKTLQHNWVLVKAGTKDDVSSAGATAGPAKDWIPARDARIIANTKLIDAGKTGEVRFAAPAAGTYQFVCTFPGHNITMFGEFTVTK